ncbi:MAG: FtsQ-type POTRA domain-containing protein [Clostridiaceae bacterium]|nr:FtsQ-type POTRA domain-containing protein [Clostridiaceae bacterium]
MRGSKPYKKAKRNRRRRRRSFNLVVSFVCFALVLAALVSAAVIFFKIGSIEVVGETKYSSDDIVSASKLKVGQSMFLFNKFASISSIFSACPYIDEIQMKRTLPDVLQIIVTPCEPAAIIDIDGKYYIIDIKGKILENPPSLPELKLPAVTGAAFNNPEVGKYAVFSEQETSKALFSVLNTAKNSDILINISSIDITRVYDINYEYLERFTVKIGTADDLEHKLKFVDAVIAALGANEKGIIDVSDGETGYFNQTKDKTNIGG